MNSVPRRALAAVGAASILLAGLGVYYNAVALSDSYPMVVARQKAGGEPNLAFFFRALSAMSAACIACFALLAVSGIQLVRGRPRAMWLLTAAVGVEAALFLSVAVLWTSPMLGPSVRAATGPSLGGLSVQLVALFPLWALVVGHWARRRLDRGDGARGRG